MKIQINNLITHHNHTRFIKQPRDRVRWVLEDRIISQSRKIPPDQCMIDAAHLGINLQHQVSMVTFWGEFEILPFDTFLNDN